MLPEESDTRPCGLASAAGTLTSFHWCVSGLNRAICPDSCSVNQMLPLGSTEASCGTPPATGTSHVRIVAFSSTAIGAGAGLNANRSFTLVSAPGRTDTLCSHSDQDSPAEARNS